MTARERAISRIRAPQPQAAAAISPAHLVTDAPLVTDCDVGRTTA